jgi:hypothetical protein
VKRLCVAMIVLACLAGCSVRKHTAAEVAQARKAELKEKRHKMLERGGLLDHEREIESALGAIKGPNEFQKWAILAGFVDVGSGAFTWQQDIALTKRLAAHTGTAGERRLHDYARAVGTVQQTFPEESPEQAVLMTINASLQAGEQEWPRLANPTIQAALGVLHQHGFKAQDALKFVADHLKSGATDDQIKDAAIALVPTPK